MKTVDRYNQEWKNKSDTPPLVILVGGAAGVGKSTVLNHIISLFSPGTSVSTGTIRSILRTVITSKENPYLYEQTFTLHKINPNLSLINAYKKQSAPIIESISKLIDFAAIEHQHYFIEGSNIYPKIVNTNENINLLEIYLFVEDAAKHRSMLTGETHRRSITDMEFDNCRQIQDFIVREAIKQNKILLDVTHISNLELEIASVIADQL